MFTRISFLYRNIMHVLEWIFLKEPLRVYYLSHFIYGSQFRNVGLNCDASMYVSYIHMKLQAVNEIWITIVNRKMWTH
jgi:hypothetical protein